MGLFDFFKKGKNKKLSDNSLAEYFELPYFGQLNIKSLEEYYDTSTTLRGQEINIDLNFDTINADKSKMESIKYILENIEKFNKQNKIYIDNDFNDKKGKIVKSYLKHHLEQLNEEELDILIDKNENLISPIEQLLNKLILVRIGLYPDNDNYITTFDYSIGKEITQYLVVITTDKDGNLNYIEMES